jgi:hypothetical protein
MTRVARIVRYVAFGAMVLFGLGGGLFAAGYAFEDPGGWTAVAMTVLWVLPVALLVLLALLRPAAAGPVFVGVTAVVATATVLDAAFELVPRDAWGPVGAVSVLGLAVALAFLGLHRAGLAGLLMVVLGLAQLLATVLPHLGQPPGEGPGLGAMLGGSSGVVVLPLLVDGALFLVSGRLAHEPLRPGGTPRPRAAH